MKRAEKKEKAAQTKRDGLTFRPKPRKLSYGSKKRRVFYNPIEESKNTVTGYEDAKILHERARRNHLHQKQSFDACAVQFAGIKAKYYLVELDKSRKIADISFDDVLPMMGPDRGHYRLYLENGIVEHIHELGRFS